jgi:DNA repair exonuclease SbcCD ATPase subunit
MSDKIEKLKKLLEVANDGISREEFLESFKKAFNQVLQLEVKTLNRVNKAIDDLKIENNTSLQATQGDLRAFKHEAIQSINSALKEQENALNFLRDKVRSLKNGKDGKDGIGIDGKDGKDADEITIINKVLKQIPDYEEEIEELKKQIEELKSRPAIRGGGTSAMGVAQAFKWILKTEEPTGLIDGSNTEYTVNHTIFAVLAFSLNGEVIPQIPNYTISKNKITFSTPLPSSYSGRDFEIKYI